jgi:phosphotransferase system  glucose/maltose/N-acetylglucosamine-specific IIC component
MLESAPAWLVNIGLILSIILPVILKTLLEHRDLKNEEKRKIETAPDASDSERNDFDR